MKVFVAHLIVMGILNKNSLEQYWSRDSILNTPFFSHYMSRNHFQNILWNLHISDPHETNPQKGVANQEPLLYKATNVISKNTNYNGQNVTKLQPVFLYNRYISGVDLTDLFLQYYSFLCTSVKWSKKFFVHCLNMVILNAHILHKKYSDSKKCIGSPG